MGRLGRGYYVRHSARCCLGCLPIIKCKMNREGFVDPSHKPPVVADEGEIEEDVLALRAFTDVVHHERTIRSRRHAIGYQPDLQQP